MQKTLATLLAATVIAVPFAQADSKDITVELSYDHALLQTESGAAQVLESLEAQAIEACTYASPILGTPKHDKVCRDELVRKAVEEIRRVSVQEGTTTASVFASLETPALIPAQ